MAMTYPKMLRNTVLVKLEIKNKDGGIYLPEIVKDEQKINATTGQAVSVGPEAKVVKEGDFVFYKNYVGNILEHETLPKGETLVVVSEDDIVGTMPMRLAKSKIKN